MSHGGSSVRIPVELTQAVARFETFGGERAAVLARMVHAVADLAESCDPSTIREVAGSASNTDLLMEVMRKAPPAKADPFAAAKLRGVQQRRHLLEAEGGMVSGEELAQQLGLTRQAVDKRRRAGRLLAVEVGARGLRYPAWQVQDGKVLAGLEEVLAALTVESPIMRIQWFVAPNEHLGGKSVLDVLRSGRRLKELVQLTRGYGAHGAP